MPGDPYAALLALLRAEAVRSTKQRPKPEPEPDTGEEPAPPVPREGDHE
ncbi:hypothetical protein ACWD5Q_12885 [Streptomyces sp. NPDC002513]